MNETQTNVYKEMYFKLLAANREIVAIITKAEQQAEELYMNADEK